jgi:hypothetical protein
LRYLPGDWQSGTAPDSGSFSFGRASFTLPADGRLRGPKAVTRSAKADWSFGCFGEPAAGLEHVAFIAKIPFWRLTILCLSAPLATSNICTRKPIKSFGHGNHACRHHMSPLSRLAPDRRSRGLSSFNG